MQIFLFLISNTYYYPALVQPSPKTPTLPFRSHLHPQTDPQTPHSKCNRSCADVHRSLHTRTNISGRRRFHSMEKIFMSIEQHFWPLPLVLSPFAIARFNLATLQATRNCRRALTVPPSSCRCIKSARCTKFTLARPADLQFCCIKIRGRARKTSCSAAITANADIRGWSCDPRQSSALTSVMVTRRIRIIAC